MSSPVRVRFAPSPTGYLHVGGARTALFNWLFARSQGGTMILRIEDTDDARNTQEAMSAITDGLRWLGLDWDEGPEVGGEFGPYYQSQRKEIYDAYLEKLRAKDRIYEEENGAIRFKFSRQPITIPDMICGDIHFAATQEPDMTIRRPDGTYIFHFVNVVDDIAMGMTHVIRGEDHISNTWKHIDLYHAFEVTPPTFGHIPLMMNADGSKMSKRDAGSSVASYREEGYLPEAVANYLCLLGWTPRTESEVFSLTEAAKMFQIEHVHHSNSGSNITKCNWLNQQHLRQLSEPDLLAYARPALEAAGLQWQDDTYAEQAVASVKEKITLAPEFPEWIHYFFNDAFVIEDEVKAKLAANAQAATLLNDLCSALATVNFDTDGLGQAIQDVAKSAGVKMGALMPLLRFAVSGQSRGPDVKVMLQILGKERVLVRLQNLIQLLPSLS